jgi:hypothetical protein
MPQVAVHFVDLQKKTNDLVMGTHGRGVVIIDDISPLRELNQEVLAKKMHFFKTEPFEMTEESGFSGSFGSETEFVGNSKSSAARIVYYLKKRHTFGKMSMEVQDMDGTKITSLEAGKSKGINVVNWNFNTNNPKMAQAKTLSFGGFTSPRVPAGKYKIVLTKGKDTYETVIETTYDEKSITTLEERKEQEALTATLFDMVEDLAYMVYEINETQVKATEVIENNPKGKKLAEKFNNSLEELRKTLVITSGDNYVASAEPELREKMGELYSNVASTYDGVSGAYKLNYELISEEFETAKDQYQSIKDKEGVKFDRFLEKNNIEYPPIKSKEAFLKKD